MIVKNIEYQNPESNSYLNDPRKLGIVKRNREQVSKFNLRPEDLDFSIT